LLLEDIGRGDRYDTGFTSHRGMGKGSWVSKASGVIAGLPVAAECFNFWANKPASLLLLRVNGVMGQVVARLHGSLNAL